MQKSGETTNGLDRIGSRKIIFQKKLTQFKLRIKKKSIFALHF